jgi:hypothetical protein
VWPAVFEYQSTLSVMYFLQALLSMFVSQPTLYKLTQHPYHRAIVVASSSRNTNNNCNNTVDRFAVASDSFFTCLWSNLLFFSASYVFGQLLALYNYHRNLLRQQQHSPHNNNNNNTEAERILIKSSWRLGCTILRRYYTSSLGAGIGSMVWPGVGTIVGMGVGDGIGELSPEPDLPNLDYIRGLFARLSKHTKKFFSTTRGKGGKQGSYYSYDEDEDRHSLKHLEHDLTCGCCQIVTFSSNPSSPDRAPVSSRECSHTICRHCVQQCHLALMERVQTYQEWISCPICKAMNAFSSHNHLVNRSLCSAISLMERRQSFYEQQLQQQQHQTQPPGQQQQQQSETERQQQQQQQQQSKSDSSYV